MRGVLVETLIVALVVVAFAWSQLMPPIPLPERWRPRWEGAGWASGRPLTAPQHGARLHWNDETRAAEWR